MTRHRLHALCAAIVLFTACGAKADFEAGQHAWDNGRPTEAREHWHAAADAGDGRAMLALGRLYLQGLGAPQNFIDAHKWFNLAASRGEADAFAERDALAAKMTPQQIALAQERAATWRPAETQEAQAVPAPAPTPEGPAAPVPAEGAGPPPVEVLREAQSLLAELGYDPGLRDGIWGRRSAQAYRLFLRDAGLPPSEQLTVEALRAMRTIAARQRRAAQLGAIPDAAQEPAAAAGPPPVEAIREAQTLLAALGYDPGRSDGMWDGGTLQAYVSFLRIAGLPVSERLTPEALRTLRTIAARQDREPEAAAAAPSPPALPRDTVHRKVQAGDIDGLEAALRAGAEVNVRDQRGWTPLMYAANRGYTLLVPALLDAGANPDTQAADGATALFMAVLQGHEGIAMALVQAGANISIRGPRGRTPLELAQLQDLGNTAALLTRADADRTAFLVAEETGTPEGYEGYLTAYPNGLFALKARERRDGSLDREAFETAQTINTAQAYRDYVAAFPAGQNRETAEQRVTELDREEFDRAVRSDSSSAYRAYVEANPEGFFVRDAERRRRQALDRETFSQATERNTIEALQAYLDAHPEGAYRTEATSQLKELHEPRVFAEATAAHTLDAYNHYLALYPDGANADLARQQIAQLEATGNEFRDCEVCPAMVVIPSGSFMMGSDGGEPDEAPRHRVTITEAFAVGKYEVTVEEFEAFVRNTGHDMGDEDNLLGLPAADACTSLRIFQVFEKITWREPGYGQDGNSPVVCTSWNDSVAYVKWLSIQSGQPYRLLSEAEWEYVARANTTTAFSLGDIISTKEANYDSSHSDALSVDSMDRGQAISVGSFQANPFGLHDLHGNALEWVEDCWHENYAGAPTDGRARTSDGDCTVRVLRGGSWFNHAPLARSAARGSDEVHTRHSHFGFRVARAIAPEDSILEATPSPEEADDR